MNCSLTCPYPFYGVECQQTCNCIQDLCDVSTGCISYGKSIINISDTLKKINIAIYCFPLKFEYQFFYLGCTPGYSGVNCSLPCPYPSYGVDCQQSCNCIQNLCDVSTGCMNSNKGKYKHNIYFLKNRFANKCIKILIIIT